MKAAWYERQGPACEVLVIGETATLEPEPGQVRVRVAASGINPGDVKKRQDAVGVGMPYPLVISHGDGAGVIDQVGNGARFPLESIAEAHEAVEERRLAGRVVVVL